MFIVLFGLVRVDVKWPGTQQESRFVGVGGSVGIVPSVLGHNLPGVGLMGAHAQVSEIAGAHWAPVRVCWPCTTAAAAVTPRRWWLGGGGRSVPGRGPALDMPRHLHCQHQEGLAMLLCLCLL